MRILIGVLNGIHRKQGGIHMNANILMIFLKIY